MAALGDLPEVNSFFGVDLKTGSLIVAALCVVHPIAYGCTYYLPISYLLVTMWFLVALFFISSIGLFYGVSKGDATICYMWVWSAIIFEVLMMMLMIILIIVYATRKKKRKRLIGVMLAMFWYLLMIYFILVVNSHCKRLWTAEQLTYLGAEEVVTEKTILETSSEDTQILGLKAYEKNGNFTTHANNNYAFK